MHGLSGRPLQSVSAAAPFPPPARVSATISAGYEPPMPPPIAYARAAAADGLAESEAPSEVTAAHVCAGSACWANPSRPHLHRDRAHGRHICTGTGRTAATSAPGPGEQVRLGALPPAASTSALLAEGVHISVGELPGALPTPRDVYTALCTFATPKPPCAVPPPPWFAHRACRFDFRRGDGRRLDALHALRPQLQGSGGRHA